MPVSPPELNNDSLCAKIRPLLGDIADGAASDTDRAFVVAHLPTCPICASHLAFLRAANTALRQTPMVALPPNLSARIARATFARPTAAQRVREWADRVGRLQPAPVRFAIGGACAAVLATLAVYQLNNGNNVSPVPVIADTHSPAMKLPDTRPHPANSAPAQPKTDKGAIRIVRAVPPANRSMIDNGAKRIVVPSVQPTLPQLNPVVAGEVAPRKSRRTVVAANPLPRAVSLPRERVAANTSAAQPATQTNNRPLVVVQPSPRLVVPTVASRVATSRTVAPKPRRIVGGNGPSLLVARVPRHTTITPIPVTMPQPNPNTVERTPRNADEGMGTVATNTTTEPTPVVTISNTDYGGRTRQAGGAISIRTAQMLPAAETITKQSKRVAVREGGYDFGGDTRGKSQSIVSAPMNN